MSRSPAKALFLSRLAIGAVSLGVLFASSRAMATQLDKQACAALAGQMQSFKTLDVPKLMEKGPEWAAANLSPGDLDLVRRYIDTDEQIKFRCMEPGALVKLKGHDLDDEEETGLRAKPKQAENASAEEKRKAQKQRRAPYPQRKPAQPAQATLRPKPGLQP